jgi:Mn-dependent DtxR family transcriptional regulator
MIVIYQMKQKMLFIYIKSLSENYRILRNSNLSKKIGVSLNTLQNAKNELIKQGLVSCSQVIKC